MKITDAKGVAQVTKKQKASSSSAAGSVSFDSLLESALGVSETAAAAPTSATAPVFGVFDEQADVPTDAKGRGHYVLDRLADLEKDILSGQLNAATLQELKTALGMQSVDRAALPPHLLAILDEIDMRASVELAKLEVE